MKSWILTVLTLCLLATPSWATMYQTSFPSSENPLTESGNWINGKQAGLNWSDCASQPGLGYGTQPPGSVGAAVYADSTCVLAGTWGPNQSAQATVHCFDRNSGITKEVELRLRTTITPGSITGYEVNFLCAPNGNGYSTIVRWNGSLASFTSLSFVRGLRLKEGDAIKVTVSGGQITAYLNGTQVNQATDPSPFQTGSPGMGFFVDLNGAPASGVQSTDYGFTTFSADDGTVVPPPVTPTVSLSATPQGIQLGQSSTLTWTAANATGASIDNGIGTVALTGSQTVSPGQTTTYTLTAAGSGGSASATATVTVSAAPPPPLLDPNAFASVGPCGAANFGTTHPVDDSKTRTWGAVISGQGSFKVNAWCNGTAWTVVGR
jgi:hypothetical protein